MIRPRLPFAILATLVPLACSTGAEPAEEAVATEALASATYAFGARAGTASCLDVNAGATADGANVQEWGCNGTGAQAWRVEATAGGNVRLVNPQSGKCLDVFAAGIADGTNIQLWTCNGTPAQAFRIAADGANVRIENPSSGKCVDVTYSAAADGTNVQLWTCNGTDAQRWRATIFTGAPTPTPNPDPTPNPAPTPTLCGAGGYAHCQATDFAKEDIAGNPKWEISTWGNANRTHSRDNVYVQGGILTMKVNGGTPKGQTTTGAEIVTAKQDFLYGSFRTLAKTASQGGTVSSPLFYYLSDTSEIDVEILSQENSRHLVNYTIHKNDKGADTYRLYDAGFDPSADFHEYRFDWSPQGVTYFIDGKPTGVTLRGNTPYQPGRIMVNHWTLSDPGWGGGPPVNDAFMYVKHFEFYYD